MQKRPGRGELDKMIQNQRDRISNHESQAKLRGEEERKQPTQIKRILQQIKSKETDITSLLQLSHIEVPGQTAT